MKKALTKSVVKLYYLKDNEKIVGNNPNMSGNCTGLSGNCSGLWGDCTGLSGNCSGLSGDLDDCKITDEERKKGVNINDLIIS